MTGDRRWALVTGASRGIGAATAAALAGAGWDVVVHFRSDVEGADKTAATCEERGVRTHVVRADLRGDLTELRDAMDAVGGVQAFVANAGAAEDGLALSTSDESFAAAWQVNVAATFALARHALRSMVRRRRGRIVTMSSVVGLHGNVGQVSYAASKAALVGMTKSLAREVGRKGITANAVAPGYIATAMTDAVDSDAAAARIPAGRFGAAEEVAAVVAFLCSDEASYVNGAVLNVDGGLFA